MCVSITGMSTFVSNGTDRVVYTKLFGDMHVHLSLSAYIYIYNYIDAYTSKYTHTYMYIHVYIYIDKYEESLRVVLLVFIVYIIFLIDSLRCDMDPLMIIQRVPTNKPSS